MLSLFLNHNFRRESFFSFKVFHPINLHHPLHQNNLIFKSLTSSIPNGTRIPIAIGIRVPSLFANGENVLLSPKKSMSKRNHRPETSGGKTKTPLGITVIPFGKTKTPACKTEPPLCKTKTPACKTEPPLCRTKTPLCKTKPPLCRTKTPLCKTKPPLCITKTPLCKTKPPLCTTKTPACITEKWFGSTKIREGIPLPENWGEVRLFGNFTQ